MKHAFIDVEAFRLTKPWIAPLVNVAAVTFDEYGNVHSSIDLYVEPSQFPPWSQPEALTLAWWQAQDKWKDLMNRVHMLGDFPTEVMRKLAGFLKQEGVEAFWFAGPQYDQIILEAYFYNFDMEYPWKYNQVRDFRTIRKQHMDLLEDFPANPNAHLALDDCLYDVSRLKYISDNRGIAWK